MKLFSLFSKTDTDPYWISNEKNQFRPRINKGDFFKLTGFDFGWLIVEPLTTLMKETEQETEKLQSFSYGQKALYFWWYLDAQVTNGGFVQFYYNGYDRYVESIIKGLTHIGDKKMADLVQKAEIIYRKNKKFIDNAREKDLFGSDLYERLETMSALDRRYYKLNKQTISKFEHYIRKNPQEFCLDENGVEFDLNFSGECKTWYPDNRVREQFYLDKAVIHGTFKSFYPNGNIKEEIEFEHGKPTGERIEYYENGNKKYAIRENLPPGQFEHYWYYENGKPQKLEHKHTVTNEQIGEYKEWFNNGQIAKKGTYIADHKREGEWLEFYENGNRKLEAEFNNGDFLIKNFWNEQGEQTLQDGDGFYIHEYSLFKDQITRSEQVYKNYRRHGEQRSFTNGTLSLYEEMENGKNHGYTRRYYKNGRVKDETLYRNNEIISSETFPKSDNPVCKVSFQYLMKEEWLKKENLPTADTYPVCINEEKIKNQITHPPLLLEAQHHDFDATTCLWLSVDEKGNVTDSQFRSAYLTNGNEFMDIAYEMQFQPATRDGKNVASFIYIIATFEIE